jgi:hypothetical protein
MLSLYEWYQLWVVLPKVGKCDSPSSLNPEITYGNQEETGSLFVWSNSKCIILIWWKGQQHIAYVFYVNAHHHNWAQTALFTVFRIEQGPSASSDLLLETNTKPTSIILICVCVFKNLFFYSFIHMCIRCLGHFSPAPHQHPLPLTSSQNLFYLYL